MSHWYALKIHLYSLDRNNKKKKKKEKKEEVFLQ